MSRFLINLDDGHLAFRDQYVDKQVNMKPVPDEIAYMIRDGKVSASDVVKAINAKIRESGEFDDIEGYLKKRADLNVRRSNPQKPVKPEALSDRSGEEVSVNDVYAAIEEGGKSEAPKAKAKRGAAKAKADDAAKVDDAASADIGDIDVGI